MPMIKRSTTLFLSLVLLGLLLANSRLAAAQDPEPTPSDNEVNRVAKQMYCPVCENIPLDVCPTQACAEWRELIRLKMSEGWTDQQIKDYFVTQYGDRVLAEPPRRGWNWLVYVLPWVFVAAGAVVVWRVLVSMRRKTLQSDPAVDVSVSQKPSSPAPELPDDPYMARMEEELKKGD